MANERTIRRRLAALGYRLEKNHSRNPDSPFYGGFIVIDIGSGGGGIVLGGEHRLAYTATLDDVEEWLAGQKRSAALAAQ